MEKLALKGKQFAGFCLLILFSILINYGGSLFATINKLPVWLDSAGTAVAAYLGGPVCGAMVGLTTNLMKFLTFGTSPFFGVVEPLKVTHLLFVNLVMDSLGAIMLGNEPAHTQESIAVRENAGKSEK